MGEVAAGAGEVTMRCEMVLRKRRLVQDGGEVVYTTSTFYKSKCPQGDSNDMQSRRREERVDGEGDKQVSRRRRPREPPNRVADWRHPEDNMCQEERGTRAD